jgi:hypothetical protein
VLNVVRRSKALGSGVIPPVKERFEGLQHESLILFLYRLRHFILHLSIFEPKRQRLILFLSTENQQRRI